MYLPHVIAGMNVRKKVVINIDVTALETIDKARGMIPRSRWIEWACLQAIRGAAPQLNERKELKR